MVSLWLRRVGLERLKKLDPAEPVIRYERKHPGELVHVDTKPLGRIEGVGHRIHKDRRRRTRGVGWEYLHVCVDDGTASSHFPNLPFKDASSGGFTWSSAELMARRATSILPRCGEGS